MLSAGTRLYAIAVQLNETIKVYNEHATTYEVRRSPAHHPEEYGNKGKWFVLSVYNIPGEYLIITQRLKRELGNE